MAAPVAQRRRLNCRIPFSPAFGGAGHLSAADGRAFRIIGPGGVVRAVVTLYRLGRMTTGSEFRVKIETLRARLTGGSTRGVARPPSSMDVTVDRLIPAAG